MGEGGDGGGMESKQVNAHTVKRSMMNLSDEGRLHQESSISVSSLYTKDWMLQDGGHVGARL